VAITVSNANDIAPVFTSGNTGTVLENAATSTVIYTAATTDADNLAARSYSLGGADSTLLAINASTGEVTLLASADFESKPSYSFDVIASDGLNTTTQAVTVAVTDVQIGINAVTLTPVGGTVVANTLNASNTNLTASVSLVDAAGLTAQLLVGTTLLATSSAIGSTDSSVSFDLGTSSTADLQAAVAAGGVVTARLMNGSTVVATSSSANPTLVVDYLAPTVTDANISIAGATGTGGIYKIGDTVTATWNNTAGGDNNADVISGVTVDFSAFGGGAAVSASNNSGTYTASYVIAAGSVDGINKNVSVTATDSAGNTTTTADITNAAVDNIAPTLTVSGVTLSADTGFSSSDRITQTAAQTVTATLSGALSAGEVLYGSIDNGATWTDITSMLSTTAISWTGVTLSGSSSIVFRITDSVGNNSANTGSSSYVLDTTRPTVSVGSPVYTASTNTLMLSAGGNLTNLLQAGEASTSDIKDRLDWSKLSWDINGDDAITTDVSFALADISSVTQTNGNRLYIVLTADKGTSLEASAGYGGAIDDKLDIAAGFFRDVAGNTATATLSNASLFHTGQAVINLGSTHGKLIAPVQVEGQWFYYWDRSGDGTIADSGTANGGIDRATHDQLDLLFTKNSSGATLAGNTTDTYRYATINSVAVALPMANQGLGTNLTGTAYSDAGATSNGTTSIDYDSLLAVWDAFNGTGTSTGADGTPPGWFSGDVNYWSATPGTSAESHVAVKLLSGAVASTADTDSAYVALVVL
jgi:hypothetical protein